MRSARSLAAEQAQRGRLCADSRIEVVDESGANVLTVTLIDAVTGEG